MKYGSLTKKSIEEIMESLYRKPMHPKQRQIMLYTGEYGMLIFDFTLKFGGTIQEKFFSTKFKRLPNIMFISLFKKQGLYKIKIEKDTFYFYKGTTLINTITEVSNSFYLDTLKGVSDIKVKVGIDKVNDYIKTLKDETSTNL